MNNNKIYISLKGGLGNQLFQYAFSLHLEKHGIDIDGFYLDFAQDKFGRSYILDELLTSKPNIVTKLPNSTIVVHSESDRAIIEYLHTVSNCTILLDGYFQNKLYVENSQIENKLHSVNEFHSEFAIHIRRGDYGHHGILPFSYYKTALLFFGMPPFRIFSDEPNYAEYMFSKVSGYSGVVLPDLTSPIREFSLLSSHAGLIMANSSFSWLASFIAHKKHHAKICTPSEWSLLSKHPGHLVGWQEIDTSLIIP